MGLNEAFKSDSNPDKINLTIGVYKDAAGQTPILDSVRTAEERNMAEETSKGYLGIPGAPAYGAAVRSLLFGPDHEIISNKRGATAHTPGGTGALRVAADFLKDMFHGKTLWVSDPTWPNHPNIFKAAGLAFKTYPYFDAAANALALDKMLVAIEEMPEGDIILLHGCCHNPTGVDPTPDQWAKIAEAVYARGLVPFFDFAYQGFATGIEEDAAGLRAFCQPGKELLVASSFSKNFGLYNERVGALTVVGESEEAVQLAFGHVKRVIRSNYSNPPAHGGAVVTTILSDAALRSQWEEELKAMRERINGMRGRLVADLKAAGVSQNFSFIADQRGMFSFSGLTRDQVQALRDQFAIYIVGSGRINVAALTDDNIGALCKAIAQIL
jgi:aspartate/tyrosine/aromatic aminotransferase